MHQLDRVPIRRASALSLLLGLLGPAVGARRPGDPPVGRITQPAYLKASNTGATDKFGSAMSASGDTVVVGAPGEASDATGVNGDGGNDDLLGSGAAYVFVRNGLEWSHEAYIKASNADGGDDFGQSVAVSGDTIVVGAPGESSNATGINGAQDNDLSYSSGAVYVFVRYAGTWVQQAYIKASDADSGDRFGQSVAVSGDTIVVGAPDYSRP